MRIACVRKGQGRGCFGLQERRPLCCSRVVLRSSCTTLQELMSSDHAPIATYKNTNPIEVLRLQYLPEFERDTTSHVFYKREKWYLQFSDSFKVARFQGEEDIAVHGVVSSVKAAKGPGDSFLCICRFTVMVVRVVKCSRFQVILLSFCQRSLELHGSSCFIGCFNIQQGL